MKLTKEEIQSLETIQKQNRGLINELGQISLAEHNLKERKEAAIKYLSLLKQNESELAKALEDKYGKGRVNTETGEFTPA